MHSHLFSLYQAGQKSDQSLAEYQQKYYLLTKLLERAGKVLGPKRLQQRSLKDGSRWMSPLF